MDTTILMLRGEGERANVAPGWVSEWEANGWRVAEADAAEGGPAGAGDGEGQVTGSDAGGAEGGMSEEGDATPPSGASELPDIDKMTVRQLQREIEERAGSVDRRLSVESLRAQLTDLRAEQAEAEAG